MRDDVDLDVRTYEFILVRRLGPQGRKEAFERRERPGRREQMQDLFEHPVVGAAFSPRYGPQRRRLRRFRRSRGSRCPSGFGGLEEVKIPESICTDAEPFGRDRSIDFKGICKCQRALVL
jgi:hypothetical protein